MSMKLFALVLALAVCTAFAGPVKKSNYIEQENSCRQVCGLCDCDGFYCEDECICECNLEDDENLQCIADMKKECDANGLEYELLMQESAKERFLREIKGNHLDLSKHLVILKQKRQSASSTAEPIVAAPAPSSEEPIVAAKEPTNSAAPVASDSIVGAPLSAALASLSGKAAIAGKSAFANLASPKLLVTLRERLGNIRRSSTRSSVTFPRLHHAPTTPVSRISFAPFPTFKPLVVQPYNLF